jgi:adenosylhomocysteine nucleosidase
VTIAVVFALHAEFAPWRARHPFSRIAVGRFPISEAAITRIRARVAICGVGAPEPDAFLDALCAEPVDALVVAGLAGALRASLRTGNLIVPRRVQAAPPPATPRAAAGPQAFVASDPRLLKVASRCGATPIETLVCASRVAGRVEEKRRLAAYGDAVDMESLRILDAAGRRGIPSAAVRVVGDAADEPLPLDFDRAIRADGTVSAADLVWQGVRQPWRWPALAAFGWRQRRAVGDLARFLDCFVRALGDSAE